MVVKYDTLSVLNLPGRDLRLAIDPKKNGQGKITVIVTEIPKGSELPIHAHADGEEIMYFIAGHAETVCDDESIAVEPGDIFDVQPGSVHTVRNIGEETVRMFCVFNPPIDTSNFYAQAK